MTRHHRPDTPGFIIDVAQAFNYYQMMANAHLASMDNTLAKSQEALARSRTLLSKARDGVWPADSQP